MSFFFGKLYQSLKVLVGTVGLVGAGIVIVYGALAGGGAVFIAGGSICLVESIFLLADSSKITSDMRKQVHALKHEVTEFGKENEKLHHNVTDLQKIKAELVPRIAQLQQTLDQSVAQLEDLERLKEQFAKANQELSASLGQQEGQVVRLSAENVELAKQVDALTQLKVRIEESLAKYRQLYQSAAGQLTQLEQLKQDYESENSRLSQRTNALDGQVTALAQENAKLHVLWQRSKELLATLASMGDRYDQFSSALEKFEGDVDDLDRLSQRMSYLVDRVQQESFEKLDLNGDGSIDQQEWDAAAKQF